MIPVPMIPVPQSLDALQDFLDTHGPNPQRWPEGLAEALAPRLETDPDARAMLTRAVRLAALIEASVDQPIGFDPSPAIVEASRTAQVTTLAARRGNALRNQLRPILALAASLFLGFLVGAKGWIPGGRPTLSLENAEIVELAVESFGLEEAP